MIRHKGLRVVYAGTPEFAVPALKALIASQHTVVGVFTQPDRPSGRGQKIVFSPIKQLALAANIALFQPTTLRSEEIQHQLSALQADVMVVAAYGLILPQNILDTPRYGCLNIHGSLLPAWRGAAPIQRAIANGDKQTGVTIMQMALGLDTGDLLHTIICPIKPNDTGQSIHDQLAQDGADGLLNVLKKLENNALSPIKQDDQHSTYAHKLSKADALINWSDDATTIDCHIRAFNPWPVAFTQWKGKPLKCLLSTTANTSHPSTLSIGLVINESKTGIEVVTGNGSLLITRLQLSGKKAMDVHAFLNGQTMLGDILGS